MNPLPDQNRKNQPGYKIACSNRYLPPNVDEKFVGEDFSLDS